LRGPQVAVFAVKFLARIDEHKKGISRIGFS
jgi:hypothetical protein